MPDREEEEPVVEEPEVREELRSVIVLPVKDCDGDWVNLAVERQGEVIKIRDDEEEVDAEIKAEHLKKVVELLKL